MTDGEDITFDESGAVPSVDFDYDALDPAAEEPTAPREAKILSRRVLIARLLALLTNGADALLVGRRAVLLAHLLKLDHHRNQRAVAADLGITPGRLSQIKRALVKELANLQGDSEFREDNH